MRLGQYRRLVRSNFVGRIPILDDPVGAYNYGINVLVLEERADHGIADHAVGDLER